MPKDAKQLPAYFKDAPENLIRAITERSHCGQRTEEGWMLYGELWAEFGKRMADCCRRVEALNIVRLKPPFPDGQTFFESFTGNDAERFMRRRDGNRPE